MEESDLCLKLVVTPAGTDIQIVGFTGLVHAVRPCDFSWGVRGDVCVEPQRQQQLLDFTEHLPACTFEGDAVILGLGRSVRTVETFEKLLDDQRVLLEDLGRQGPVRQCLEREAEVDE